MAEEMSKPIEQKIYEGFISHFADRAGFEKDKHWMLLLIRYAIKVFGEELEKDIKLKEN